MRDPEHDPMAPLAELHADVAAPPTAAESLIWHAEQLVAAARRLAATPPEDRIAPGFDKDTEDEPDLDDQLRALEERELALRSVLAAVRRETYQALRDRNWSVQQIADQWQVTNKSVYKVLGRR
ncbi:hypothetical protein [Amycolatopsis sp. NPDC058986]|uniref:hypothetical protein n=1 Tax=unclassified Amycolatopsis TaxID=2618356 RepID=UPI0036730486